MRPPLSPLTDASDAADSGGPADGRAPPSQRAPYTVAQLAERPAAVVDGARALSAEQRAAIAAVGAKLRASTGSDVAVVTAEGAARARLPRPPPPRRGLCSPLGRTSCLLGSCDLSRIVLGRPTL